MDKQPGVGDRITMKKPHACKGSGFTVIGTGADIKIKCDTCGRIVILPAQEFAKKVRN